MARTYDETIREITHFYVDNKIDVNNPPTPNVIQADILEKLKDAFDVHNVQNPEDKWKYIHNLIPAQIADIMLKLYDIAKISYTGDNTDRERDILAIYQTDGENMGIYVEDDSVLYKTAKKFRYSLSDKDFNEVKQILNREAPRKTRCNNKDLIAVNNGIFDYETKQLMPFDPDFVFVAKSKVNYYDDATNVKIHNFDDDTDWDVESWMEELTDDPEVTNLLWQILGAVVRPNVPWNKAAWFYSEKGNNGKGTLCELMRQLCGSGTYASIPLSAFGQDFILEQLINASAIIVDENDVGTFIDKAANLKAVITGDTICINRKHKSHVAYQFKGFMVQCLNELPRIKDKSDSFFRRQIFVPFTKCFTGRERKYIKNDYLNRQDVLEYVLYKVLNMNYYEFDEPKSCTDALDAYKEYNDPIRQFCSDVLPDATWDLLPFTFLYDIYKEWFKRNAPSGIVVNSRAFQQEIKSVINTNEDWTVPQNPQNKIRTSCLMEGDETLASEYGLVQWQRFERKAMYSGIVRKNRKNNIPIIVTK